MTEWRKVKLGDCCEITSSKRIFYNEYVESGVPFYRSKEIIEKAKGDTISTPLYISHARFEEIKESFGAPQKSDILLTAVGSLGVPYLINDSTPFYFKDGNLIWFKSFDDDLNSVFLYYWFKTRNASQMLDKIAIGSAQKALTISSIKQISIEIPARDIQDRIVTALSRYDALIENYQRQIKLLEEAAQRLYKEWFVDLRFPGHQSTPIINNLPQGWQKKKLGDLIELQSGYAFKSSTFESDGKYKIVTIKNVKDGSFDGDNVSLIKVIPEKMPSHCSLLSGDILLSLTGNVGRVCMMIGDNYLLNQRVAKLKTNYPTFAYALFRSHDMFIAVNNLANGAAQQNVSPIRIAELPLTIPPKELLDSFERIAGRYRMSILKSQTQIHNLSEARDRLLPKLMSTEIEV